MDNNFNYELTPSTYAHCFNQQCVKGNSCLHHLVAEHCTAAHPIIYTINPLCVPGDTNACPYFRPIRKTRMAWGIKNLLDKVPHEDAKAIKSQMMSYFGKTSYYRFYRKEKGLTPESQRFICRIFSKRGIAEEPVFEHYTEEYIWD